MHVPCRVKASNGSKVKLNISGYKVRISSCNRIYELLHVNILREAEEYSFVCLATTIACPEN